MTRSGTTTRSDAAATLRRDLLAELDASGHGVGRLSSSALSTATAVSAFSAARRAGAAPEAADGLIRRGVEYIVAAQNDDGGWGDTDRSFSNIATTMLARAAFHLAGVEKDHALALEKAVRYIEKQGGFEGLRHRYGKDKTFAVPIMMNQAVAGLVDWHRVAPLPFDRSSTDLTAHAIRAFLAWKREVGSRFRKQSARAIRAGFRFLARKQRLDGSWRPLWFGNQYRDDAPIGFYFAKLWYYERLYPLVFATAALREAGS